MLIDSQMCQEGSDFLLAHCQRMPLVMKKNVALDPEKTGLFGAITVMANAYGGTDLLQSFQFRHGCLPALFFRISNSFFQGYLIDNWEVNVYQPRNDQNNPDISVPYI